MDTRPLVAHIPSLRRYARALTGDAWAADDLVQDTLERACVKWRLWTVGTDLRAWLFTLMHNVFANQLRRAPPRAVDIDEVAHDLAGADTNHDKTLDLQRCLLRLPEDQRAVLLLIALEDLSYAQVAGGAGHPRRHGHVAPVAGACPSARADGGHRADERAPRAAPTQMRPSAIP